MGCLASVLYDPPGGVVSKSTASLLALTQLDTTNLRLTFTAPSNGSVLVRLCGNVSGATTFPRILLGAMDGASIVTRVAPMGQSPTNLATTLMSQEAVSVVSGLTPGNSYTWDAAYGVEIVLASTNLRYGGPDDATGADANGGFLFEVWETPTLLGSVLYDPAVAVTKATTSLLAMTQIDTTNARITFTAPASGKILWRIKTVQHGSTTFGQTLLGVMDGATVKGRVAPIMGNPQTSVATACCSLHGSAVVSGLNPGNIYSYDAAYAVQVVAGAGGIKYGGPNNTTTNDAFGALCYEIWQA